jgi:putative acetyltransferase
VVAYLDDVAVGCGAVRRRDEATAELKRMYVDRSARGRGIGRAIKLYQCFGKSLA